MATTLVFNPITGNFDSVLLATANVQAWMATPSSANLLAALSDKTGTGLNVFGTAPTLTGPVTLTEAVGSSGLTITGATQTASFPALNITQTNSATSGTLVHASLAPTFSSSSTSTMVGVGFRVAPTINYSNGTPGAGSYEALKIAVTETALPTGTNYLIRASAGAAGTTDKWSVTNSGAVTQAAGLTISSGAIRFANSTGDIGLVGTSIQVVAAGGFSWSTNSTWNSTGDVFLRRDAAGTLALRNSTNAQTFNIYNTYTDASNYERGFFRWSSNILKFGSEAAGTGTLRGLQLGATGTSLGFFGATPVAQPTTAIAAATFTANAGTAVNDASTFDGYTLNQIVKALRNVGLLA